MTPPAVESVTAFARNTSRRLISFLLAPCYFPILMLHLALTAALAIPCQQPPLKFQRWEREVVGIEKRLAADPPAKGGVVFAGSSSIRLWDVRKAFPDLPAANVGFGGS